MAKAGTPLSEFELRERRMIRRMQPFLRGAATVAGLHATCALPKCRRARQCLGCHPVDEIGSSHFKNFPPCVIDDATQAAVNEGSERFGDMMRQEALDAGYSAEQIRKVEIGERMPGGELLAALLDVGGDVVHVLAGSSGVREPVDDAFPTAEELHQARLRERIRAEARAHARLRADRRKKVLTDEEADLVECYRELTLLQREQVLPTLRTMLSAVPPASGVVIKAGKKSRVAGRDLIESGKSKKPK